jgi:SAM-dependent methyltransferase
LGAGTAAFSSMACMHFPGIEKIYAVEVVPEVVRLLQPKIVERLCGDSEFKVQSVIGSFNKVDLPDNSVDFCIEVESLHHSENLNQTLKEAARILKPGGCFLLLDRAHHNSLSEAQRQLMLNIEYSDAWKRENGYALDRLTRAENGEHEIRLCEWEHALAENEFRIENRLELRQLSFKKLLRSLLLCLPFHFRRMFNILPSRVRPQKGEISWLIGRLLGLPATNSCYHQGARDYTILLARRTGESVK